MIMTDQDHDGSHIKVTGGSWKTDRRAGLAFRSIRFSPRFAGHYHFGRSWMVDLAPLLKRPKVGFAFRAGEDQIRSALQGLIINFIHHWFPSLLRCGLGVRSGRIAIPEPFALET